MDDFTLETKEEDEFLKCYVRIVSPPQEHGVLIIHSNQRDVSFYIKQVKSMKVVANMKQKLTAIRNTNWSYSMIIIVTTTVQELEELFKQLYLSPGWKPRTRYVIVYLGEGNVDDIFAVAWQKYIINIIVLHKGSTNIYTYFPYGNGECAQFNRAEILGSCENISMPTLFPPKVPKMFNGCVFRTNTRFLVPAVLNPYSNKVNPRIAGYELTIVNTVLQKMNLTRRVIVRAFNEFGRKIENVSYTNPSPLYDLHTNVTEMVHMTLNTYDSRYYDFDFTNRYLLEPYYWYVPVAGPGPQWKSIFLIFEENLWYSVFGFLCFNTLAVWYFGKLSHERKGFIDCVLESWVVLLSGGARFPRRSVMRYIVVSWSLCALVLIATYQSQLLSILMKPVYEKQIRTNQDIVDTKVPVILLEVQKFGINHTVLGLQIARKGIIVGNTIFTNYTIQKAGHIIFMASSLKMKYIAKTNLTDSSGKMKVYPFKISLFRNMLCLYLRKGHPMLDRWNELLSIISSSGLTEKWLADLDFTVRDVPHEPENVAISVHQLSCAFFLLGVGLLTSILIFLFEKCLYYLNRRKIKKDRNMSKR